VIGRIGRNRDEGAPDHHYDNSAYDLKTPHHIRNTKDSGDERISAIATAVRESDTLALQGIEAGVTWGMTVGLTDGKMTLNASGGGTGYLAFGSCTFM